MSNYNIIIDEHMSESGGDILPSDSSKHVQQEIPPKSDEVIKINPIVPGLSFREVVEMRLRYAQAHVDGFTLAKAGDGSYGVSVPQASHVGDASNLDGSSRKPDALAEGQQLTGVGKQKRKKRRRYKRRPVVGHGQAVANAITSPESGSRSDEKCTSSKPDQHLKRRSLDLRDLVEAKCRKSVYKTARNKPERLSHWGIILQKNRINFDDLVKVIRNLSDDEIRRLEEVNKGRAPLVRYELIVPSKLALNCRDDPNLLGLLQSQSRSRFTDALLNRVSCNSLFNLNTKYLGKGRATVQLNQGKSVSGPRELISILRDAMTRRFVNDKLHGDNSRTIHPIKTYFNLKSASLLDWSSSDQEKIYRCNVRYKYKSPFGDIETLTSENFNLTFAVGETLSFAAQFFSDKRGEISNGKRVKVTLKNEKFVRPLIPGLPFDDIKGSVLVLPISKIFRDSKEERRLSSELVSPQGLRTASGVSRGRGKPAKTGKKISSSITPDKPDQILSMRAGPDIGL